MPRSCKPGIFEPHEWFPVPSDWSGNIVTGKVYNTQSDEGSRLVRELELRTASTVLFERERTKFDGFGESPQARYGAPIEVLPRLGQGAFRIKVAGAYSFQCAISDTKVLPALEAAHIRPYSSGGLHEYQNGLLLRKDIHSVLDSGFATISDDYKFHVSSKIREIFNNGNEYIRLHGASLKLPAVPDLRPSSENVRWHQQNVYVGD